KLYEHCAVSVVKTGKNGSLVKYRDEVHQIGVIDVQSIDTTGAGDLYAAGFLFGLAHGLPVEKCGRIGALAAGKVIEVLGAKMKPETWKEINKQVQLIVSD
ncbi:MAG: PfkB family carbohydrate kinase, partial [Bacteroidota bacterium]